MNNFTNIPFSRDNLDRFYQRNAIFKAIEEALPFFKGELLDVGCGKMPYRKYILENSSITSYTGLDIETAIVYDDNVKPDITWDGVTMPIEDNTYQTVFATEVLEHCPYPGIFLNEVIRVLKPGGLFFFTVPFLWNLHEVPHDEYRYTPFSLQRHLQGTGFKKIELKATGGWHASMAQMLGLWVRRSPMSNKRRKTLSYIIKPIMKYLIKIDRFSLPKNFDNGPMITGLCGTARKIDN